MLDTHGLAIGRAREAAQGGIDLTVLSGATLAIAGANGSGKSTLGLTLAGLLPPIGGVVTANEALAAGAGPYPIAWRSQQLLTRIDTVFQQPEHQFLASTVRAELAVGPSALGLAAAEIDSRVTELLERLRLGRLAEANPFTLSVGEKRRLSVARLLATRPGVLVLDEPTFGQDSRTWAELVALLAKLVGDGTALVAITYDLDLMDALADSTVPLA